MIMYITLPHGLNEPYYRHSGRKELFARDDIYLGIHKSFEPNYI